MKDTGHLLKAFIRNPTSIGAVVPSSRSLAIAMTSDLCLKEGDAVLELGPGTGPLTAALSELISDGNAYLGIERAERFVTLLRQKFPTLHFVHGDAADAHDIHAEAAIGTIRYIISGLPFASLPALVRTSILDSVDYFMQKGCMFRTFQYVHAYKLKSAVDFRGEMTNRYGSCVRSKVVLKNIPPAYTLTWTS